MWGDLGGRVTVRRLRLPCGLRNSNTLKNGPRTLPGAGAVCFCRRDRQGAASSCEDAAGRDSDLADPVPWEGWELPATEGGRGKRTAQCLPCGLLAVPSLAGDFGSEPQFPLPTRGRCPPPQRLSPPPSHCLCQCLMSARSFHQRQTC